MSLCTEIVQALSKVIARDEFALAATNVRRIRNATIAMLIANVRSRSGDEHIDLVTPDVNVRDSE